MEYLTYIYWLCPAYLYGILPTNFYQHFCKLVYGTCIIHHHKKSKNDLIAAHIALLDEKEPHSGGGLTVLTECAAPLGDGQQKCGPH